jgi:hypothetical protein
MNSISELGKRLFLLHVTTGIMLQRACDDYNLGVNEVYVYDYYGRLRRLLDDAYNALLRGDDLVARKLIHRVRKLIKHGKYDGVYIHRFTFGHRG